MPGLYTEHTFPCSAEEARLALALVRALLARRILAARPPGEPTVKEPAR